MKSRRLRVFPSFKIPCPPLILVVSYHWTTPQPLSLSLSWIKRAKALRTEDREVVVTHTHTNTGPGRVDRCRRREEGRRTRRRKEEEDRRRRRRGCQGRGGSAIEPPKDALLYCATAHAQKPRGKDIGLSDNAK